MKYLEPNVVVIDDKYSEVMGIIRYYNDKGIGCKYFNADLFEMDAELPPEKPYSDVNLIFLDLFYSEQPFDPEMPAGWVRRLVHPKTFYVLVLWTKDQSMGKEVLEILRSKDVMPYIHITKSKKDFVSGPNEYNFAKLFESIDEEINKIPVLDEILIWKNSLKRTSNVVLGGLVSQNEKEFTNKLKKIIMGHGGKITADSSDHMRKRSVLFEALDNVLVSNVPQYVSEEEISKDNESGLYNLNTAEAVAIDEELNSWFHFILKDDIDSVTSPGVIALNNSEILKKYYSIQDDLLIKELISHQQASESTIIEDIVLNITRPCDYAQNKFGKNMKFLSGIAVKKPVRKGNITKDIKLGSNKFDCVIVFDHLFYNKTDCDLTLIFDFRYSFSIPENIFRNDFKNVKMLNKELLSEIQVEYSSYVSRLGYTKII